MQFKTSNGQYTYIATVKTAEFEGKRKKLVSLSCNDPASDLFGNQDYFLPVDWQMNALFSLGFNPEEVLFCEI